MKAFHLLLADARPRSVSQDAAADAVGVSRDAISRWERGQASPPSTKLAMLCDAYGLDDGRRLALLTAAAVAERAPAKDGAV